MYFYKPWQNFSILGAVTIFDMTHWKLARMNHINITPPLQVTTHSKLLSTSDRVDISAATDIEVTNIMLETLQSFDTEQQFSNKIK